MEFLIKQAQLNALVCDFSPLFRELAVCWRWNSGAIPGGLGESKEVVSSLARAMVIFRENRYVM